MFGRFCPRFVRRLAVGVVGVVVVGVISACGGDARDGAFGEALLPIVFKVAKDAVASLPLPYRAVAELGISATEEAAKQQAEDRDATYLFLDQVVGGQRQVSTFRIDTTRKLRIDMDGRFVAEIERNLITIRVDPAVESTIVVTDAADAVPVFFGSRFAFEEGKPYFDLDTGRFGDPGTDPAFAAAVDFVEPRFAGTHSAVTGGHAALRNGARAADWGDTAPTLNGCAALPESDWDSEEVVAGLFSGNRWSHLTPVFCIRTNEGRYGALALRVPDGDSEDMTMEYVLWKKPGD